MNHRALWGWLVGVALVCLLKADAQPVTTLYSFVRGPINPHASLTLGNDGNFYGTTSAGGKNLGGTIYRMTTNGALTTLFQFSSYPNGAGPTADLTLGPDGYFYGTTIAGGTNLTGVNAGGVVFKMTTNGIPTTVVNFIGTNGGHPDAAVTLGPDGCYYGTTEFSGSNNVGTVFKVTTNGLLTTLVTFNNTNGANPGYSLTLAPGGTFYGTTKAGGEFGYGTAFKLTTNGNFTMLHSFNQTNLDTTDKNSEGASPAGRMALGPDGNLYGTTLLPDTAFQMTTNGVVTTLFNFEASNNGTNGGLPYSGLTLGPDGNYYGTTSSGGTNGTGTIFQVTTNGILAALNRLPGIQYQYVTNGQGFTLIYYSTNNFTTSTLIGTTGTLGLNGTFTELYSFSALTNSDNGDGADPESDLTVGPDGNLYGTTVGGGTYGAGAVFKISTNGTFTALASFAGNTGYNPYAGVTAGPNGSLYGVVKSGGTTGYGTAYKVNSAGQFSLLNNFSYFPNGANPQASLIQGPDGNFYGTAAGGGTNLLQISPGNFQAESFGTVFKLSTNGAFTMLAYFSGTNGANPYGGLAYGPDGNFFGTTSAGGISNNGVVFELYTNGALIALTNFTGVNGAFPYEGLTLGLDGNFYGTTEGGGSNNNGTVFQVTPAGALKTLVYFNGTNGANPNDGLTLGRDGNLYGTTYTSTPDNSGTVFQVTPGGAFTNLYTFVRSNFVFTHGQHPVGGLAQGPDGGLYGTTALGGVNNSSEGTLFKITTNGTLTTLNSFLIPNGSAPFATLTLQTNSHFINFYGTTLGDGSDHPGTVYRVNLTTSYAITENTAHTFLPLTNEAVWITGGTVGLLTAVATNGTAQISGSGIAFLPATNFTGTATINYTVTDNAGGTNTSFITILVTNIPPVANPDFYSVVENSSADVLSPLVNDQVNTSGGVLGLVSVSATNGAAVISGTNVLFTPTASFTGTATIGYTITDNIGGTNTSLITVTVTNAPVVVPTVIITSPTSGEVVTNQEFLANGSVTRPGNSLAVTNVYVQLNGGAWQGAASADGFTNWAAGDNALLPPGSNTVSAYLVDINGNVSATNSVTFDYVFTPLPSIPGTPITWTNPGGQVVATYTFGFAGNPVPIQAGAGGSPASTGQAGDLVLLFTNNGVTVPTNWAAVVRFFNPADLTGSQGLEATYEQTFFATNFGGSGFNGYQLFPVVSYIPAGTIATNASGPPPVLSFTTTYVQNGPAGGINAGQEDIDVVSLFTRTSAVIITSPTNGQVVSNATLTVTGTATNYINLVNSALTNVFVQLNGGGWTNATTLNGWTNWLANVTLIPGSNTVSAYAVNGYGSVSATNSVTFDYAISSPVTADLGLSVSTAPEPVGVNSNLVYSITITNQGPNAATSVTVSNQLAAGVTFVSATGGATPAGGVLLLNLGSLTNGAGTNVQVTVQPAAAGKLTNLFQVFSGTTDPVLMNNFATVISTVTNAPALSADLSLSASAAPEPVGVNSNLVYSISITNQGPNAASGVTLSNQIPAGVTFVSATGGATPASGVLLVNLGSLTNGVVTNVQVTVQPTAAGKLTNLFQVFSSTTDPMLTNNFAAVISTVTNPVVVLQADLKLSASAAPEPVGVNSNLVYSISITNQGPNAASGVTVSNQIPSGVTFVSATGGATPASGVLLVNLGSLTNGTVTNVQVIVQPTAAGKLTNLFQVFSSTADPVLTNNSATVISTVTNGPPPPVDVAVSVTAAPNPVAVGAPLTLSVTVTNNSITTATGVVVSNTLPPNVTLFSLLPSQGSATNQAGLVIYSVGTLANGIAATLAIVVVPNAAGSLTNSDSATSAQTDSQTANNRATNVITVVSVPITNLVLTVLSPMTLNPQTGLYEQQIEVSNGGPSTPSSVLVEVSGLKANATLYNATGKTNGLPYVQSASPLGIGSNVVFLLEFYVPTRVMPTNLTYIVQAGPVFIPAVANGTIVKVQKTVVLDGGNILVEFKAVPGQIYAVQYSSDMRTWRTAVPAITAPANVVQWIDSGPPGTVSSPAQAGARFYRVVLLNKH